MSARSEHVAPSPTGPSSPWGGEARRRREAAGSARARGLDLLLDLLRVALRVGAIVTVAIGPREQSLRLVLTFVLVWAPRRIHAPRAAGASASCSSPWRRG